MADKVKQILTKPIQLADQIIKAADDVKSFRQECAEIKIKTEKLAALLRQAARASNDLYERPTKRIIDDTEQVLDKTLTLIFKCRANGLRRVFTIIHTAFFRKTSQQLENSIGDVSWLLRVSAPADDRDDDYLGGLPPIAANEPILCLIWEQIAVLCSASLEERADAAASLVSLARDNDRYGKLIIEEGGVGPLMKLLKEGRTEGQEHAARAIGLLGRDPESIESIVTAGVSTTFSKILKQGHMKVQVVVAWALSELVANHPKSQEHFASEETIRALVSRLAYETIQEHSKYTVPSKQTAAVGKPDNNRTSRTLSHPTAGNNQNQTPNQMSSVVANTLVSKTNSQQKRSVPLSNNSKRVGKSGHRCNTITGASIKGRAYEDPQTKAEMKAMAARALWHLSAGNLTICKIITESRALLCFAVLLEKGHEDVQYNSAMALMEISAVAEENAVLRRSAFKPTTPACKAVVDQFFAIIQQPDSYLLIPCIKAIGNLARTFRATETRVIPLLVRLLDETEADITMEAAIALNKFACTYNFLHINHSKAIIEASGVKHLIQLVYFGEHLVQIPSLALLCYLTMHVPDNDALAQEEVLIALEWATKQAALIQDPAIGKLLLEAKSRLELYQSRGSRGFH